MHLWVLMYSGNTAIYRCLLAVPRCWLCSRATCQLSLHPRCTGLYTVSWCTTLHRTYSGCTVCTVLYCNVLHFSVLLHIFVLYCVTLYCTGRGGVVPHVGPGLPLLLCLLCDRFYINQMYCLTIADLYIFYWSFIKLIHFIYNLFNFQVLYRVILKNMIFIKVFWFKWIFWFIESFSGILVLKWLIGVKSTEIVQIWSLNYVKWFSIFNWSYDLKKNGYWNETGPQ